MRKAYISTGILSAVIGLLMIFAPEACIRVTVIVLGIAAIVNGLYNAVYVRRLLDDEYFGRVALVRGIASIVVGAAAVALPLALAGAVWTVMLYLLGAYLLLAALAEIYLTAKIRQAGYGTAYYWGEIALSIILAAILFAMPASIGIMLVRVLGALLIVFGAGFVVWEWRNRPLVIEPDSVSDADD